MVTTVIKRNGTEVPFDKSKISSAIQKAMMAEIGKANIKLAEKISSEIEQELDCEIAEISEIERLVYTKLIKYKQSNVACAYEK